MRPQGPSPDVHVILLAPAPEVQRAQAECLPLRKQEAQLAYVPGHKKHATQASAEPLRMKGKQL